MAMMSLQRKSQRRIMRVHKNSNFLGVAICPWIEAIVNEKPYIMSIKCLTCEALTMKPMVLVLKIETLQCHQKKRTIIKNMPHGVKKGNKYVAKVVDT